MAAAKRAGSVAEWFNAMVLKASMSNYPRALISGSRQVQASGHPSGSIGELAEWLNAPVLKTGERESVPRVRIPGSPPKSLKKGLE